MKTKTELENESKPCEIRKLLLEALEALLDPLVLERVERFRARNPHFKYDARMITNCAVNELRALIKERAASTPSLALPQDGTASPASSPAPGKLSFPLPQWFGGKLYSDKYN